jgi:hypothetical protein
MKKILYVDLESFDEHITINNNCIKKLQADYNLEISYAFKKDYCFKLGLSNESVIEVPLEFYPNKISGGLINRFYILNRLFYLKRIVDFKKYDIVFFSCYEEITFFMSNIPFKVFLLNHNNVNGINSKVKKFFLKLISKRNTMIVFEEYMRLEFLKHGIENVSIVKHGLPDPFTKNDGINSFFNRKKMNDNYNGIIFSPSSSSSDFNFVKYLINSKEFIDALERKKFLFILKDSNLKSSNKNILVINEFLSKIDYGTIFLESSFILLPYANDFNFRISNVLNECISNNKVCLLSDIQSFREYSEYFKHNYFYKNFDDFMLMFNELLDKSDLNEVNYFNLDKLENSINKLIK